MAIALIEIPDELAPTVARVIRLGLLTHRFQCRGKTDDAYRLLDAWATQYGAPPLVPDELDKAIGRFLGGHDLSLDEQLALSERRVASCSDALKAEWEAEVERLRQLIADRESSQVSKPEES